MTVPQTVVFIDDVRCLACWPEYMYIQLQPGLSLAVCEESERSLLAEEKALEDG